MDVPIIHGLYNLYKTFHIVLLKFPKSQRYSLGGSIQTEILDCIKHVLHAAANKDKLRKRTSLQSAAVNIDALRLLIRLAKDCQCLSNKQYLDLQLQLHQIGKMLGGWIKSL